MRILECGCACEYPSDSTIFKFVLNDISEIHTCAHIHAHVLKYKYNTYAHTNTVHMKLNKSNALKGRKIILSLLCEMKENT